MVALQVLLILLSLILLSEPAVAEKCKKDDGSMHFTRCPRLDPKDKPIPRTADEKRKAAKQAATQKSDQKKGTK